MIERAVYVVLAIIVVGAAWTVWSVGWIAPAVSYGAAAVGVAALIGIVLYARRPKPSPPPPPASPSKSGSP